MRCVRLDKKSAFEGSKSNALETHPAGLHLEVKMNVSGKFSWMGWMRK